MKRREFISSAVASAALAAVPGVISASTDKFDGAVLRTGHIGTGVQGQHLLRLSRSLPGIVTRSICDVLPFRLEAARDIAGPDTQAVDDYRRVLDDPEIDAVFIATPFYFHMRPLIDALDAQLESSLP